MLNRQALYVAEKRTITFRNAMNHSDPDGYIAALGRRMAAIMETTDLEDQAGFGNFALYFYNCRTVQR